MTEELRLTTIDLYSGRERTIVVRVGDRVSVREWSGDLTIGTVEAVHDPIKNDRPGIDYVEDSGAERWAYLDQIERSVR